MISMGFEAEGEGKLYSNKNAVVVRKIFTPEHPMRQHSHPGYEVVLTVVYGDAHLQLQEEEEHHMTAGTILIFNGEYSISGTFTTETMLVISLIKNT